MNKIMFLLLLVFANFAAAEVNDWHLVTKPTAANAKIYGGYTAGCMDGGVKLPDNAAGYVLGGVHGNRFYGQPELIDYINKFGEKIHSHMNRILIIGDLSSPRGGGRRLLPVHCIKATKTGWMLISGLEVQKQGKMP